MNVADLMDRLFNRYQKEQQTVRELAIRAVEGKKITDAEIDKACQAAGCLPVDFAVELSTLQERKAAWDAGFGRDWAGELEAAKADYRGSAAELAAIDAELTVLRTRRTKAKDAHNSLSGKMSRIKQQEQDARQEAEKVLRATGAPDDWRAMGPPQPKVRRNQLPGTRIVTPNGTYSVPAAT